jgi:hypothetical protein
LLVWFCGVQRLFLLCLGKGVLVGNIMDGKWCPFHI